MTFNFGGKDWTVSESDFRLIQVSRTHCVGGLFPIQTKGGEYPTFIVGALFLKVCFRLSNSRQMLMILVQNVYSIFRANPPSVGFATLATSGDPAGPAVTGTPLKDAAPHLRPFISTPALTIVTLTALLAVAL